MKKVLSLFILLMLILSGAIGFYVHNVVQVKQQRANFKKKELAKDKEVKRQLAEKHRGKIRGLQAQNQLLINQIIDSIDERFYGDNRFSKNAVLDILSYKVQEFPNLTKERDTVKLSQHIDTLKANNEKLIAKQQEIQKVIGSFPQDRTFDISVKANSKRITSEISYMLGNKFLLDKAKKEGLSVGDVGVVIHEKLYIAFFVIRDMKDNRSGCELITETSKEFTPQLAAFKNSKYYYKAQPEKGDRVMIIK